MFPSHLRLSLQSGILSLFGPKFFIHLSFLFYELNEKLFIEELWKYRAP